ncbi:MAG: ArsR/SmtB family transcription factor [Bacteroidales bacterium]
MPTIDPEQLELAASRLKAIAHPMRIALIGLLQDKEKLNVTEIYSKLNIEQASASHHLNILKNNGILSCKRDGKMMYYSLKSNTLSTILECINKCNNG